MRKSAFIGAALAMTLATAVFSYTSPASAQPYSGMMGPGMMGPGYGPGMMGPGYGPGMMGPGMMGPGYGPGMMGQGYGPGMMGPGYGPSGGNLNLSTDDVKSHLERWLTWRGNQRLKLGEVKEKDATTIVADIVTKDNSLVQRFEVNRQTGFYRPDGG
jgi:hypothetical protein